MVDSSDLQALLGRSEGSEDDEGGFQHDATADKALGSFLELKKSTRKSGILETQRQGYLIRLRALDLLEVGEEGAFCCPCCSWILLFFFGVGREQRLVYDVVLLLLLSIYLYVTCTRASCAVHSPTPKKVYELVVPR